SQSIIFPWNSTNALLCLPICNVMTFFSFPWFCSVSIFSIVPSMIVIVHFYFLLRNIVWCVWCPFQLSHLLQPSPPLIRGVQQDGIHNGLHFLCPFFSQESAVPFLVFP